MSFHLTKMEQTNIYDTHTKDEYVIEYVEETHYEEELVTISI